VPQRSFNANVGATATGLTLRVPADYRGLPNDFGWEISFSGVITANDVDLEGSFNGAVWFVIDSYTGLTNTHRDVVANVNFLRAKQNALTGTTPKITVDIMSRGGD
jgi:hypothetical protein